MTAKKPNVGTVPKTPPNPTIAKPRKRRDWRPAFLEALAQSGNALAAAKAAQIDRSHAFAVRRKMPDFAKAWDAALVESKDRLMAKAREMALHGDKTMLPIELKAHIPEVYGDRTKVEHSGSVAIDQTEDWRKLRQALAEVLGPHPELLAALEERISAL